MARLRYSIRAVPAVLCLGFILSCQTTPTAVPTVSQPTRIPEPPPSASPEPTIEIDEPSEATAVIQPAPTAPPKSIDRSLPESMIGAPAQDQASRQLAYNTKLTTRSSNGDGPNWQYRRTDAGYIVGFEFSNHGGNRILPPKRDASKNIFYGRDFQFRFDDRARQDIHLLVIDWAPSRDRQFRLSELMNSLIVFFPRRFLPAIASTDGRKIITLPTGEEVEFNAQTQEISSGVLSEEPVDLSPDRSARKFPVLTYKGKGLMVRANARGADPRIGTVATITTGSPAAGCDKGPACGQCQVPARELWDQNGALRFKFATDQEFNRFLLSRCQFGIPEIDTVQPGGVQ
jgi:hypothetical protein